MSKTKMRCITCGKWFQSANAREVTCPECTQKARKEKLASKNAPTNANKVSASNVQSPPPRTTVPPKPKQNKGGTNQWLDSLSDVKIGEPEPPPQRPKIPPSHPSGQHERPTGQNVQGGYRNPNTQGFGPGNNRTNGPSRSPAAYHVSNGAGLSPTLGQRPPAQRQPAEGGHGRGAPGGHAGPGGYERRGGPGGQGGPGGRKPWQKGAPQGAQKPKGKPKGQRPTPKPKREKMPPPAPFVPTDEQIKQIEERYIELAQPTEFDGIRSQIATELKIPKRAVKKVIKELRDRQHIPSWWELQSYKGSPEDLERIREVYKPYLPVPPVGVHKLIAETLQLKPGDVYQAIKAIRQELNLPQYNSPDLHPEELNEKQREAMKKDVQAVTVAEEATVTATATPEQLTHE